MNNHHIRTVPGAGLAVLLAACASVALAQSSGTLAERRLAVTKGTTPGKVLIDAPDAAASAPAAGSATPDAAAAQASPSASSSAASAPARTGLFSRLSPPTGRPLSVTRRFDAPDQGIVIKPTASAPAGKP